MSGAACVGRLGQPGAVYRRLHQLPFTEMLSSSALARPDRLVSVNDGSRNGLGKLFRLAPTTLGAPQNYGRLLEELSRLPWYGDRPARTNSIIWPRNSSGYAARVFGIVDSPSLPRG